MEKFRIIDGPSQEDLFDALRLSEKFGPITFELRLGTIRFKIKANVFSIGSGWCTPQEMNHLWDIVLWDFIDIDNAHNKYVLPNSNFLHDCKDMLIKSTYSTKTRTGTFGS